MKKNHKNIEIVKNVKTRQLQVNRNPNAIQLQLKHYK